MGIPVSNRQGYPSNTNSTTASIKEKVPKEKKVKQTKEQKEKAENDFKQSLEGLSIVGAGVKKWRRDDLLNCI